MTQQEFQRQMAKINQIAQAAEALKACADEIEHWFKEAMSNVDRTSPQWRSYLDREPTTAEMAARDASFDAVRAEFWAVALPIFTRFAARA